MLHQDGFFRTGDRGERKPNGMLKITGRTKEIFKTSKGKYVAPAPIENLINVDSAIESSMVTGSGYPSACALVVLNEDLRAQAGDQRDWSVREKEYTQETGERFTEGMLNIDPLSPLAVTFMHDALEYHQQELKRSMKEQVFFVF